MDTTTVEVKVKTRKKLNDYKEIFGAESMDEVIQALMKRNRPSMAGKLSVGRKVSMKEILKNLREKHDRN